MVALNLILFIGLEIRLEILSLKFQEEPNGYLKSILVFTNSEESCSMNTTAAMVKQFRLALALGIAYCMTVAWVILAGDTKYISVASRIIHACVPYLYLSKNANFKHYCKARIMKFLWNPMMLSYPC